MKNRIALIALMLLALPAAAQTLPPKQDPEKIVLGRDLVQLMSEKVSAQAQAEQLAEENQTLSAQVKTLTDKVADLQKQIDAEKTAAPKPDVKK
jgi:uncharacterized protein YlxW (UPF0749 family)